mmetsp:Transcript_81938/g.132931  ORF Transcript_81938/g.132931 Transcript_81938/m.132931 type:complete len:90 (-) Transcript_81938:137-406(-)
MSMCCNACEKYYNNICSYNQLMPTGEQGPRVPMNSVTLKSGLIELCKREKMCSDSYPCSFVRGGVAGLGRDTPSILGGLVALLCVCVSI